MISPTNDKPIVSIIIPAYNRENFISETLNSMVNQCYQNWECIIVDDGSTDNTRLIADGYCQMDNRFKLYNRNRLPKGAPTCRNIGIAASNGDYIIFLDSDDLLAPTALKYRVKSIQDSNCDVVIFPQLLFNEKPYDNLTLVNITNSKNVFDRFLSFSNETDIPWVNNSAIWNAISLKKYNIQWDEQLLVFQDIDFNLNIFWHNLSFYYSNTKPDCFWRQNKHITIGKQPFSINKIQSTTYLVNKIYSKILERKLQTDERLVAIKRNYYSLIHIQCIKHKEYRLAMSLLKHSHDNNIINLKDLIMLFIQIFITRFLQFSDRARKIILDNYNVIALSKMTVIKKGDFNKHLYERT